MGGAFQVSRPLNKQPESSARLSPEDSSEKRMVNSDNGPSSLTLSAALTGQLFCDEVVSPVDEAIRIEFGWQACPVK